MTGSPRNRLKSSIPHGSKLAVRLGIKKERVLSINTGELCSSSTLGHPWKSGEFSFQGIYLCRSICAWKPKKGLCFPGIPFEKRWSNEHTNKRGGEKSDTSQALHNGDSFARRASAFNPNRTILLRHQQKSFTNAMMDENVFRVEAQNVRWKRSWEEVSQGCAWKRLSRPFNTYSV